MILKTVSNIIIPKNFYRVLVFKTKNIEESENTLDIINIELNNLVKTNYRNYINKSFIDKQLSSIIVLNNSQAIIFNTIIEEDNSVSNYIFITEDEILKAASYSGNIEGILYCKCYNYKNMLANEFKKQYKIVQTNEQFSLI